MTGWFTKLFGGKPSDELDCHAVAEQLQQYLDAELDDEDRARLIALHLDKCRDCGLEAAAYERIKSTLSASAPDVPAESLERLRSFGERLARGEGEPTGPSPA